MKYAAPSLGRGSRRSPPARGAWIEIVFVFFNVFKVWSPPARGAWIEIAYAEVICGSGQSPPARGAWIEIWHWRCPQWYPPRRPPQGGRGLKS